MKIFGTDGIRDIVGGEKMNEDIAEKFAKAMAFFCLKRNLPEKIVVGRDTRESGPELEEAVVRGATAMGVEVILTGVVPTPAVSYLVREQEAGAGIVISASHNPYDYNGLKPFKNDGMKLTDEEEKEVEKYILEGIPEQENRASKKKRILPDAKEKYINFLLDKFSAAKSAQSLALGSKKIVLDCANGATFEVAPAVFEKIADSVSFLSVIPDGKNINAECGSQHTENLKREVKEKNADLGLALDGDGDRVIAIDEKGQELTGDHIVYAIAKMLKDQGRLKNDVVVTTVMSNLGFTKALENLGIKHIVVGVGDRQVLFEMQKRGSILGGEEAGHIICSDIHPAGDGIAGGAMLIAAIDYFKKPLSELAGEITLFPKILVNVPVKNKPELGTVPEIQQAIKAVESELGKDGRVLVRYSGTENLCRVMVEGENKEEVTRHVEKISEVVRKSLS